MKTPRLIALAGSLRVGSWNKKLLKIAIQGARDAGAEVTCIDLRDYPMPILDQDEEAAHGLPQTARQLKALFREHDGFLLAAPEYNGSFSGVLKNTIDWVSRPSEPDEPPLVAFAGKTALLMSASIGALGGLRGLVPLRALLGNIGVIVLPNQISIPEVETAFTPEGELKDARKQAAVQALGATLADYTRKLRNGG